MDIAKSVADLDNSVAARLLIGLWESRLDTSLTGYEAVAFLIDDLMQFGPIHLELVPVPRLDAALAELDIKPVYDEREDENEREQFQFVIDFTRAALARERVRRGGA